MPRVIGGTDWTVIRSLNGQVVLPHVSKIDVDATHRVMYKERRVPNNIGYSYYKQIVREAAPARALL